MEKLNILFNTSPGSFKSPGGGEIQLLKTKEGLEKLGHTVKVLEQENYDVDYSSFDVFHNFNIHGDNLGFVKKAKSSGLAVAVSTIYWPGLRQALFWNKGTKKATAFAAEALKKFGFLGLGGASRLVKEADLLLPNSRAEAQVMQRQFRIKGEKISVVHNGVEKRMANAKPGLFGEKTGLKDFVLYVGRIEERKNVLGLVRAMRQSNETLVVLGDAKHGSESYYEKCRREAGKSTVFVKGMEHNSKLLESAYAACRVFCLPSWYETPGLAALEAGLAGANIVVTRHGCTQEYFGDMALYVEPSDLKDIEEKVCKAIEEKKTERLSQHILENFLWENTALETEKAYKKILK